MARARSALLLLLHLSLEVEGQGMGPVTFLNFLRKDLELQWQDFKGNGVPMGTAKAMADTSVGSTFEGHVFRMVAPDKSVAAEFRMKRGQSTYVVGPDKGDKDALSHQRYLSYVQEAGTSEFEAALGRLHEKGDLQAVRIMRSSAAPTKDVGMGVVFKNFKRWNAYLFWDDGTDPGVYNGEVTAMGETASITSFPGHAFKVMRQVDGKYQQVAYFVMDKAQRTYILEPEPEDLEAPSYLKHLQVTKHLADYLQRTGKFWLGNNPPDPPTLPIYAPGSQVGDVVHVAKVRRRTPGGPVEIVDQPIRALTWQPHGPNLFFIQGLLSDKECEHVVGLAEGQLRESKVGGSNGFTSKTRSSKLTFLARSTSETLEAIHERFADVLNVTDDQLKFSAEHLQVVRYEKSQEYSSHYDFEASTGLNRLATLLVYLDPADKGGGTSFPRAFADRGLEVRPERGDAILFYSMQADGNLDELSLHAGTPVAAGVKRVCNLWMHAHGDASKVSTTPEAPVKREL